MKKKQKIDEITNRNEKDYLIGEQNDDKKIIFKGKENEIKSDDN